MKSVVARERCALSRSQTTSSGVPILRRTERRAWMTQRLEAADAGAADPYMPGNVGLRELPLAQQRRGRQAALLPLLRRQLCRSPNVAFHRAPPHDDGHRPMLHLSREDQ